MDLQQVLSHLEHLLWIYKRYYHTWNLSCRSTRGIISPGTFLVDLQAVLSHLAHLLWIYKRYYLTWNIFCGFTGGIISPGTSPVDLHICPASRVWLGGCCEWPCSLCSWSQSFLVNMSLLVHCFCSFADGITTATGPLSGHLAACSV